MPKTPIKKRIKRILRNPRLLLITAVFVVLGATLLFANKGLWRHMVLKREIAQRSAYLATLTSQEEVVNRHIALLKIEDAGTIERIARERYNMKRLGETIFRAK